jgi:predicted Zn-dependent protease
VAAAHLEQLDQLEERDAAPARRLTKLYRRAGALDEARRAIQRVLDRQPYDPSARELAAAIALQLDDGAAALGHLHALTVLEPDRAVHHTRLAALLHRMGRPAEAATAAANARRLDPNAPVQDFLAPPGDDTAPP